MVKLNNCVYLRVNVKTKTMMKYLLSLAAVFVLCCTMGFAQELVPVTVDYNNPKTYVVGGVAVNGNVHFGTKQIVDLSGLSVGMEVVVPGDDLTSIVKRLWNQRYFDNVSLDIFAKDSYSDTAYFVINIEERPRISRWDYTGVKKGEKEVRENEELMLLKSALNVDEDMDNLRYNKIIIATDADVDGMHIRLLMVSFFLKYYPDLVRQGHVYILQTPLFRVRNKKRSIYCYNEDEKNTAIKEIGAGHEITRFKGLGEISADEFKEFIGENMRLDPVRLDQDDSISMLLQFYLGNNTVERQLFIRQNLRSDLILEIV